MKIEQPWIKSFVFGLTMFIIFAGLILLSGSSQIPEAIGSALYFCLFPAYICGAFWRWASFGPKGAGWLWIGVTYFLLFIGCRGIARPH